MKQVYIKGYLTGQAVLSIVNLFTASSAAERQSHLGSLLIIFLASVAFVVLLKRQEHNHEHRMVQPGV
jgi:hypothetical protein